MPDNNFVNIMLISGNINYFNRIIKKYDTLAEYQALGSYYTTTVNFDPGNNLQTTLVLGTSGVNALTYDCNYLLVYTTTNNTTTIQQRWWVMDQKRTRAGQYTLSLKRDVIADFYDTVVNSPCFIEKATIRDWDNPLIFNKEDMTFNQIKKQEILIKDTSKMAWLVGYISRTQQGATWNDDYQATYDYTDVTLPTIKTPPTVDNPTGIAKIAETTYKTAKNIRIDLYWKYDPGFGYGSRIRGYLTYPDDSFTNPTGTQFESEKITASTLSDKYVYEGSLSNAGNITGEGSYEESWGDSYLKLVKDEIDDHKASISANFYTLPEALTDYNYVSATSYTNLLNYNGKTFKDTNTSKYYKIQVTENESTSITQNLIKDATAFATSIDSSIKAPVEEDLCSLTDGYDNLTTGYTVMYWDQCSVTVSFVEYIPDTASIKISAGRNHLIDAPYDMFAIPYTTEYKGGPLTQDNFIPYVITDYTDSSNWTGFQILKENALHIAQSIAATLGANCYDIQVLPYCPFPQAIKNVELYIEDLEYQNYQPTVYLKGLIEGQDYDIIKNSDSTKNMGVILWANYSSFTFDQQMIISVDDPKLDFETKVYRFVSPNYSGMFEFSPAMNGGMNQINVDATYKPYSPYIHLNPNFNKLYGSDFNDNRGLICMGDFSIAMMDDKWANFQNNNKNYQLIFDREVQNLAFTRKQERVGEAFDLITGTASGAAQGAMVGGWVGAIVGGAASATGGAIDIGMSEARYKENLSLKKDLYGYNLGNIRAMPASITKATSLNENFKFWPFLEIYDCSEIEKEALKSKLKFEGMTVMKVGKMADYIANEPSFIKGQIIRLENLREASNLAYEIFNEIKKGVYI